MYIFDQSPQIISTPKVNIKIAATFIFLRNQAKYRLYVSLILLKYTIV